LGQFLISLTDSRDYNIEAYFLWTYFTT